MSVVLLLVTTWGSLPIIYLVVSVERSPNEMVLLLTFSTLKASDSVALEAAAIEYQIGFLIV